MSYQNEDFPFFDYEIYHVAGLAIRGPSFDLSQEHFVCLGAAQSFGRYVNQPYTHILAKQLQMPCLNLAIGGAGPTLFQNEERLAIINRAKFAIVQVMSARAESNTIFKSDGKSTLTVLFEGLRFANANEQKAIHEMPINREIARRGDLTVPKGIQLHSTAAYQILAENKDDLVCEMAIQESKLRYAASMSTLLKLIKIPKLLFYFSEREPKQTKPPQVGIRRYQNAFDIEGLYPQFVDEEVMGFIEHDADQVIYCVSARGKPHRLPAGMLQISPTGQMIPKTVDDYYPSPEMHEDAAECLSPVVDKYR